MPSIKFSVPHQLSVEEASRRLKNAISDLKVQFGDRIQNLKENWSDNEGHYSFEAMGFRVAGGMVVRESSVDFYGNVPFAALPFKGKIESAAKQHITTLLS
jgi:Putative polyhydroxyalkanoic acid system protein (PHA_gran_rgn)